MAAIESKISRASVAFEKSRVDMLACVEELGGTVESVLVDVGAQVSARQVLATLIATVPRAAVPMEGS